MELVTRSFASQALSFPNRVDQMLAEIKTLEGRKEMLDQAAAIQKYATQLKAGIEFEKPIALGVLKIKAGIGELLPRGKVGAGRGNKNPTGGEYFPPSTLSAYRKLADNQDKLEEYAETIEDVPSQSDFIRWCGSDNVIASKHGNNVVDWYTPESYIEKTRAVLGDIDLDPASSKHAQKTVQAATWYSQDDDGLEHDWSGRVFLNPPYKMPLVQQFVFKLCDHVESGDVKAAILLTNNCTDPKWWQRAAKLAACVCFTAGRISFYNKAGEFSSPTNGQTFCYFGKAVARFRKHFDDVGVILD